LASFSGDSFGLHSLVNETRIYRSPRATFNLIKQLLTSLRTD